MTDARTARRLERLEAQVDVLTRALHLLTVSAKPTSEWLDAKMQQIDADVVIRPVETLAPSPCEHGRRFCTDCHGKDFL